MPRKASSGVHSRGVGDVGRPWTVQERRAIYDAVVEFGENEWNLVRVAARLASLLRVVSLWSHCGRRPPAFGRGQVAASMLPYDRTVDQCTAYWKATFPVVRGAWSAKEDALLTRLVERNGARRWNATAAHIPGRNAKQCRERWVNNLDPSVKKTPWTQEEDDVLIEAQGRLGNRWSRISRLLSGRPDNAVKNRWYCLKQRAARGSAAGSNPQAHSGSGGREPDTRPQEGAAGAMSSSDGRQHTRHTARHDNGGHRGSAGRVVLPVNPTLTSPGHGSAGWEVFPTHSSEFRSSPPTSVHDPRGSPSRALHRPHAQPLPAVQLSDPPPNASAAAAGGAQQYSSLPPRQGGAAVRTRPASTSSASSLRRPTQRRRRGASGTTPVMAADVDELTAAMSMLQSPGAGLLGSVGSGMGMELTTPNSLSTPTSLRLATPTSAHKSLLTMALESPLSGSVGFGHGTTPPSAACTPNSWRAAVSSQPYTQPQPQPWGGASEPPTPTIPGVPRRDAGYPSPAPQQESAASGAPHAGGFASAGAHSTPPAASPALPPREFPFGGLGDWDRDRPFQRHMASPSFPAGGARHAAGGGVGGGGMPLSSRVARLAHQPHAPPPPPPSSALRHRATLPSPSQPATAVKVAGIAMAVPALSRPPPGAPPVEPIAPAYAPRDRSSVSARSASSVRNPFVSPASSVPPRAPSRASLAPAHGTAGMQTHALPYPGHFHSPASLMADSPSDHSMGALLGALESMPPASAAALHAGQAAVGSRMMQNEFPFLL